ncbi:MAG TPA: STAS domain-containing protein [Actinomycetota bacterium]|nr:STAS domain-containing protein [Actinomycetota bacterium]
MTRLSLDLSERDGIIVGTLDGEIDFSNARSVGEQVLGSVSNEAVGVVLDMSGIRYLDSAGVSMFFEVVRQLEVTRQRLALVLPQHAPLRRLLSITSLDAQVEMCESVDDCIRGLQEMST